MDLAYTFTTDLSPKENALKICCCRESAQRPKDTNHGQGRCCYLGRRLKAWKILQSADVPKMQIWTRNSLCSLVQTGGLTPFSMSQSDAIHISNAPLLKELFSMSGVCCLFPGVWDQSGTFLPSGTEALLTTCANCRATHALGCLKWHTAGRSTLCTHLRWCQTGKGFPEGVSYLGGMLRLVVCLCPVACSTPVVCYNAGSSKQCSQRMCVPAW